MRKASYILTFFISLTFFASAEEIVLKNNKALKGKIVEETKEFIKVEIEGLAIKYYWQDIETIDGKKVGSPSGSQANDNFKKERVLSQDWLNHYGQAERYLELNHFDQATLEFEEVLKIDPESFEAHTGIGFIYIQLGKYDQALASFNKAIEINPEYAQAYDNIGVVYSLKRQYQEAIPYFEKAIYVNPEYAAAYNNLGSTYLFLNRYPEAVIYYQKAFQIDPQNADSAYNLGVAYQDLGKSQDAKDYFKKALELYRAQNNSYGAGKAENRLRAIP